MMRKTAIVATLAFALFAAAACASDTANDDARRSVEATVDEFWAAQTEGSLKRLVQVTAPDSKFHQLYSSGTPRDFNLAKTRIQSVEGYHDFHRNGDRASIAGTIVSTYETMKGKWRDRAIFHVVLVNDVWKFSDIEYPDEKKTLPSTPPPLSELLPERFGK